jgi:Sulfotransferase family
VITTFSSSTQHETPARWVSPCGARSKPLTSGTTFAQVETMDHHSNPILVTGSHRSGTTWVGRMLASAPGVAYIHEPFNIDHRPGILSVPSPRWLMYISRDNGAEFIPAVNDMLEFRYHASDELGAVRSPRDVARMARDWSRFRQHARRRDRPLLKDPLALMSAEWLSDRFHMDVVVMIRHPAAFASSIKRLGWPGALQDMLGQPMLMRDVLAPFRTEIEAAVRGVDIIDQAILEWRIDHYVIGRYRSSRPDWLFVRHEDIARDPVPRFRELFSRLGLRFTDEVRSEIASTADPSNPAEPADPYDIKRNSRSSIATWRDRLTEAEIERVYRGTRDIWPEFYTEEDWAVS